MLIWFDAQLVQKILDGIYLTPYCTNIYTVPKSTFILSTTKKLVLWYWPPVWWRPSTHWPRKRPLCWPKRPLGWRRSICSTGSKNQIFQCIQKPTPTWGLATPKLTPTAVTAPYEISYCTKKAATAWTLALEWRPTSTETFSDWGCNCRTCKENFKNS